MANPAHIWGIKGEESGGAGTGNANGPEPDFTEEEDCGITPPDAPHTDNRTLWVVIKDCLSGDASQEWVPIDDPTYTIGSVWRVDNLVTIGESGPCVYVSNEYRLSLLVPEYQFPYDGVRYGPYPSCTECTASISPTYQCWAIQNCNAPEVLMTSTDMSSVAGGVIKSGSLCYTVASEPTSCEEIQPGISYVTIPLCSNDYHCECNCGGNGCYLDCSDLDCNDAPKYWPTSKYLPCTYSTLGHIGCCEWSYSVESGSGETARVWLVYVSYNCTTQDFIISASAMSENTEPRDPQTAAWLDYHATGLSCENGYLIGTVSVPGLPCPDACGSSSMCCLDECRTIAPVTLTFS